MINAQDDVNEIQIETTRQIIRIVIKSPNFENPRN